jgi:hypothetical protein
MVKAGRFALVIVILAFALAAVPAPAAVFKDVNLPDSVSIDGRDCLLNGVGLRKKLFISVYLGALYLPGPSGDAAAVINLDEPKQVLLHFIYSKVSASQLKEAWEDGFKNNVKQGLEPLKERIASFMAFFDEDMAGGERIIFTYRPGRGTTVTIKGRERGTIEGADFMRALFSVWFGEAPPDKGLKKGMLGGK